MPQTIEQNATQGAPAEPERTFTQAQMDAIIGDRLARERSKYSDYEELKAKAAAFDDEAEMRKSDLQKAEERAQRAEAELAALKERASTSAKTGSSGS